MTKIERARELRDSARRNAAASRRSQTEWAEKRFAELAEQDRQIAEMLELEACMYGDLLRLYGKTDSAAETVLS